MTMQLFTGEQYLKIDIANNFGHDKLDWDDRIEWFDSNKHKLPSLVQEADTPQLFYAAIKAWDAHLEKRVSHYPVSHDATASGLQILALLTGCTLSAQLCNVVDTGHRRDAYKVIYDIMLNQIGEGSKISRDDVKYAIMTSLYSSRAVPRKVFGDGSKLLELFYSTMNSAAPGAWALNEHFLSFWNPNALANVWELPDGFKVRDKIMAKVVETVHFQNQPFEVIRKINHPIPEGRSLGANITHSIDGMVVREMVRRCMYDPNQVQTLKFMNGLKNQSMNRPKDQKLMQLWKLYEDSGFFSARIIQYIDDRNIGHVDYGTVMKLVNSFPLVPFEILTIHDCFRCLPNYANDLRIQYNNILADIAGSDMLSHIVSQVLGKKVYATKLGNLAEAVRDANYALS